MKCSYIVAALSLIISTSSGLAWAKDFPVQARLFAGATKADPADVNLELGAEGLKKVDTIAQYGVEITYPLAKFFNVGIRYTKHYISRDELISTFATDYEAELNQDSALLVGRVALLKSTFVRLDGFAGFGGTNTTLKMKTASQDGQISRKDAAQWFASPYSSYGGSLAIGYKQFYLVFEGGFETNKISGLKRTGTVNNHIETIDLSGGFFTVGLLFDGISATRK
jgi:hypothetical protein